MRIKAVLYGLVEAAASLVDNIGLTHEVKSKISLGIKRRAPSHPFVSQRVKRFLMPPPKTYTEYGYLEGIPQMDSPEMVEYVLEEHITPINQRGTYSEVELLKMKPGDTGVRVHWDLRFRDPYTKRVHAWAIPRAELPNDRVGLALKVDDRHGHRYLINKGKLVGKGKVLIPDGYGRGTSRVIQTGKALVWTSDNQHLHIHIPDQGTFALVKQSKNQYLLLRKYHKEHVHTGRPFDLQDISGDKQQLFDTLNNPDYFVEEKLDGAFYTVRVNKDGYATVISRRPKHVDGQPTNIGIDKSMNMPQLKFAKWPRWVRGRDVYVEIHSDIKDGYPHEFNRAAAILNSEPVRANYLQKASPLRVTILGVSGFKNPGEQRAAANRLSQQVTYRNSKPLSTPMIATSKYSKRFLYYYLKFSNKEGIVLKHRKENKLKKFVFKGKTVDMRIIGVELMNTSQPKYMKGGKVVAAQRFLVEDPTGKQAYIVIRNPEGKAGSTDQLRLDAGMHPDKYIGTFVTVRPRRSNRAVTSDIVRIRNDK